MHTPCTTCTDTSQFTRRWSLLVALLALGSSNSVFWACHWKLLPKSTFWSTCKSKNNWPCLMWKSPKASLVQTRSMLMENSRHNHHLQLISANWVMKVALSQQLQRILLRLFVVNSPNLNLKPRSSQENAFQVSLIFTWASWKSKLEWSMPYNTSWATSRL